MRQGEKLLKELQDSFKKQVDEFRGKKIRVFKTVEPLIEAKKVMMRAARTRGGDNVSFISMIAAAIVINLAAWYTIIFYIVIPALGKLQEMGIIPTF